MIVKLGPWILTQIYMKNICLETTLHLFELDYEDLHLIKNKLLERLYFWKVPARKIAM